MVFSCCLPTPDFEDAVIRKRACLWYLDRQRRGNRLRVFQKWKNRFEVMLKFNISHRRLFKLEQTLTADLFSHKRVELKEDVIFIAYSETGC
jgi:hypothetical protein